LKRKIEKKRFKLRLISAARYQLNSSSINLEPWRVPLLVLTRKLEESIIIGDSVTVSVLEIKGNQVKLGISAPKDITINRAEIYENVLSENIRASNAPDDVGSFTDLLKSDRSD
jgi:carbon storage regulator